MHVVPVIGTTPSMKVAVAGAVFTEDDKMVTDVSMMLMDENIQSPNTK